MANRFTDSRKWDDDWFLELSAKNKLLWLYMVDKCNHAGIYKQSRRLEYCCLDSDYSWEHEIEKAFGKRLVKLKDNKYFLPGFIEFQYGVLNPENRCHKSVIDILEKEGAYKELKSSLKGCKDKDKVKVKVKVLDKDIKKLPISHPPYIRLTQEQYKTLCKDFGVGTIKDYIQRINDYLAGNKGKDTYKDHSAVIRNWLRRDKVGKQKAIVRSVHNEKPKNRFQGTGQGLRQLTEGIG